MTKMRITSAAMHLGTPHEKAVIFGFFNGGLLGRCGGYTRVLELAERKEHLAREILGSEGTSEAKKISTSDVLALLR